MERACQLNGSDFMGRELFIDAQHAPPAQGPEPGKPVEGCWFCLSNPSADVELVASIGQPRSASTVTALPSHKQQQCCSLLLGSGA